MATSDDIKPNSTDRDGASVHQTSPGVVLTFVRWGVRDSLNTDANAFKVRKPLVVYSDVTQISVSQVKGNKNSAFSATLTGGDINYSTAVHTGDFVFVNMLDWESDAERVVVKALDLQPINKIGDGFKGLFRIQSVVRRFSTSPEGQSTYIYQIQGQAFSELDNVIVFNPAIAATFKQESIGLFQTLVGDYYANKLKSEVNVEVLLQDLFEVLIGKSNRSNNTKVPNYGNKHYKIPQSVGQLLGIPEAKYASNIYNLITGIWPNSVNGRDTLANKFNPKLSSVNASTNVFKTGISLQGDKLISNENWNNKTAWSIMQDNLNSVMNEMYTTFRVAPNSDRVMPTIIARQKPFTNPHFEAPQGYEVTKFLSLPRWKLKTPMVFEAQFAKNEAMRFNFVQVYTRMTAANPDADMATQIATKNFVQDNDDIQRHGVKPYIVSSNFDFPVGGVKKIRAKEWAQIVSDWVINGNLKESGFISCVGLQEPIAVGDNLEFDGIVYHIEAVQHMYQITRSGNKTFKTNLSLSYGIDIRSNEDQTYYPEMEFTDRYTRQNQDYNANKIMPGFSDTQDIISRRKFNGEERVNTKEESFALPNKKRKKE